MNFPFYIAKRYLLSKKSTNAINIISMISMLGVFIGSAALLVILSVFNGFEGLILSLFNEFSADIRVEANIGKRFDPNTTSFDSLRKQAGVLHYVDVLEEKALLRFKDMQHFTTLKGVGTNFAKTKALDSALVRGEMQLNNDTANYAVIGTGVDMYLGGVINTFVPVSVFTPSTKPPAFSLFPTTDFSRKELYVSGVFSVQKDFDENYAIVPLRFMRSLLKETIKVTSVEITLKSGTDIEDFKENTEKILGDGFVVKNRFEQNPTLYKLLNSEKWAVYLILTFVLLIAICNIIGSLTMLVIDKKKDIAILFSMGADHKLVRRIFIAEGMLISIGGCLAGLLLGTLFCLVQKKFGLISMEQTSFIEAYPVALKASDFLLVFITVFVISLLASWFSINQSLKSFRDIKGELTMQ